MNFSSPSPRFKQRRNEIDSPTSPSDRPLMYSSSASESSSFDMETVPMLSDVESLASPTNLELVSLKQQRRRGRFARTYIPCVAFLVMAFLSYFYVDYDSSTGRDPKTAFTKTVEEEVQSIDVPAQSPPTHSPTQRPTAEMQETEMSAEDEIEREPEVKTSKKHLVLHIGPQKTGSTTLQDAWSEPFGVLSYPLKMDKKCR